MLASIILLLAIIFGLDYYFKLVKRRPKVNLDDYSSKIKNIYIELYNYSYFHSPAGLKKVYNRFVGRDRIIEKLKSILTNSETRSGAYLVTGFRGMGKTSLVRKVLAEIKGNQYYSLFKHVRIYFFLLIIALFKNNPFGIDAAWIDFALAILLLLALWYLTWHDRLRPNLKGYYQRYELPLLSRLREIFKSALRVFDPEQDYYRKSKFRIFLQDFILINFLYFIYDFFFPSNSYYLHKALHLFYISVSYFVIIYFINNYQIENRLDSSRPWWKKGGYAFKRVFVNAVHRLDYGNRVAIEISLSQDELKEVDVLRLLAQNIYAEYKALRNRIFTPNRIILPILILFTVYAVSAIMFYNERVYHTINEYRLKSGFVNYFPSQAIFPLAINEEDTLSKPFLRKHIIDPPELVLRGDPTIIGTLKNQEMPTFLLAIDSIENSELVSTLDSSVQADSLAIYFFEPKNYEVSIKEDSVNKESSVKGFSVKIFDSIEIGQDLDSLLRNYQGIIFSVKEDPTGHMKIEGEDENTRTLLPIRLVQSDSTILSTIPWNNNTISQQFFLLPNSLVDSALRVRLDSLTGFVSEEPLITSFIHNINQSIIAKSNQYFIDATDTIFTDRKSLEVIVGEADTATIITKYPILSFQRWTRYIDYLLFQAYQNIFTFQVSILEYYTRKNTVLTFAGMSPDFRKVPLYIDYFFLLFFFILLGLVALIGRNSHRVGIVNHRYILSRLRELNDNISAHLTYEQRQEVGVKGFSQIFNIFSRRERSKPIAGVREIESELIDILRDIDRIPPISSHPEFIFVFDELDKLDAYQVNIVGKEGEELSSFSSEEKGYFSTDSIRKRQEAIAKILGNLKLFFNTAKAKFIFIAGREMFDAALADISDRDSFISSIFHEVIYVNSFFKDPANKNYPGITGLTEKFVCQLLMPLTSEYERSLKGYNEYLEKEFPLKDDILKRRKIIYILQNFITYLTYRSNGSPKKITKLLEELVRNPTKDELGRDDFIVVGRNSGNLYLYFNYNDQYRIGFIDYLFKPYLLSNSRHMRDYEDKLLIATSFLIDHLYKFHRFGFSWSNLELTPEVISVSKSPKLREFISDILDFLSNYHIEEILNGLYQFKFSHKIANEFSFISKISEYESAAFNFTLDESLQLKRHLRKKLNQLSKYYNAISRNNSKSDHINSIAFINQSLGDLHFYDQEYGEALIHYMDAVQSLVNFSFKEMKREQFVFLLQCQLKLGLTYEKMKNYDLAFISYGNVTKLIRDFSRHYLDRIKYREKEYRDKDLKQEKLLIKRRFFENIRLLYQPFLARLQLSEKASPNGLTQVDIDRSYHELSGITDELEQEEKYIVEMEFSNKIGNILFYKNGRIVKSSHNTERKDNSTLKNYDHWYEKRDKPNRLVDEWDQNNRYPTLDKEYSKYQLYKPPVSAYYSYMRSLRNFAERNEKYFDSINILYFNRINILYKDEEVLKLTIHYLYSHYSEVDYINRSMPFLMSVGNTLSNLGDTLICFIDKSPKNNIEKIWLKDILENFKNIQHHIHYNYDKEGRSYSKRSGKLIEALEKAKSNAEKALVLYLISGFYYLRVRKYNKYALQLRKVLYFLRSYVQIQDDTFLYQSEGEEIYQLINDTLFSEVLYVTDEATHHTRRQEISENEHILDYKYTSSNKNFENFLDRKRKVYTESWLIEPDAQETLIIYHNFKLLQSLTKLKKDEDIAIKQKLLSPYAIANNRFVRTQALNFRVNLNHKIFGMMGWEGYFKNYIIIQKILDIFKRYNDRKNDKEEVREKIKSIKSTIIEEARQEIEKIEDQRLNEIKENINNINFTKSLSKEEKKEKEQKLNDIRNEINSYISTSKSEHSEEKEKTELINILSSIAIKINVLYILTNKIDAIKTSDLEGFIKKEKLFSKTNKSDLLKKFFVQDITTKEAIEFLITDSIYCLSEIIKCYNIFGLGYITTHSFLGNAHLEFAEWCGFYHQYIRLHTDNQNKKAVESIEKKIENLVGKLDVDYLDIGYHYKMALHHFGLAASLHNAGTAYWKTLGDMYYLDDDFNDSLTHFCAAMERYRINTGHIKRQISKCRRGLEISDLFLEQDLL